VPKLFTGNNFRADGDWMSPSQCRSEMRHQGVSLHALRRGTNLEVFQYEAPDQNQCRRKTATSCHLAFAS
jgi:hypothetical protein